MDQHADPELIILLFEANQVGSRLRGGDLSAAARLAIIEVQLARLALQFGLPADAPAP
jgi:hypothetical protein